MTAPFRHTMARANSDGYLGIVTNLNCRNDLDFDECYSRSMNDGYGNSTRKSRQPLARCKSECGTSSASPPPPLPVCPNGGHCRGASTPPMPRMDSLIVVIENMDSLIITIEKRDQVSDRSHRADLSCDSYYSIDAGKHGFLTHRATDSTGSLVLGSFPKCEAPRTAADLSPRCALPYQERKRLVQEKEKERRWNEIAGRVQSRQRQRHRLKLIAGACGAREMTSGEGGSADEDNAIPVPARRESDAAQHRAGDATEAEHETAPLHGLQEGTQHRAGNTTEAEHETAPSPGHQESYAADRDAENLVSDANGIHGNHNPPPTNTTARWCGQLFAKATKKAGRRGSGRKEGKASVMGRFSICRKMKK